MKCPHEQTHTRRVVFVSANLASRILCLVRSSVELSRQPSDVLVVFSSLVAWDISGSLGPDLGRRRRLREACSRYNRLAPRKLPRRRFS